MQLTPHECRVLGVLVEKAQTTPAQYPLTVNAIVSGCNQKSNRNPIVTFTDNSVTQVLDALRGKSLVTEVYLTGSRVVKYRHEMRQALELTTHQICILAELMLRGPQTIGDIRGRVSRMHPIESLEMAHNIVDSLMENDPPMIAVHPPPPGSRAEIYSQLLCPQLHPIEAGSGEHVAAPRVAATPAVNEQLTERVETLEAQVKKLTTALESLATSLGEPNPFQSQDTSE